MRRGGGKASDIKQSAAADDNKIRLPVEMMAVELFVQVGDECLGIFRAFAAGHVQWRPNQRQFSGGRSEIIANFSFKLRLRLRERIVQNHQHFSWGVIGQRVQQHGIAGREHVLREEHAQLPTDRDGALDDRHADNLKRRR